MEFLKKLSGTQIAALIGAGLAVLLGVMFLTFYATQPKMVPLYNNLSQEDSTAVLARLQAMNVPHTVSTEGQQISVSADQVFALRMLLAQQGVPSTGSIVGYEIFDKSDTFGTSQFIYNVNLVRALEGELSRTISSLSPIESARVHLVIPRKELFSKHPSQPSASVVLKFKGGHRLSKQEIAGITHLIATAIPELKTDSITIIDDSGQPLKLGNEEEFMNILTTGGALEYKTALEERLTKTIEDLVAKSVGAAKVKAKVTAELDFDREITNSETYNPDGQVVRSQRTSEEKEEDIENRDNVSVANNIPNYDQEQQIPKASKNKIRSDEITNYEISKTVSNKISENGRIKSISVAVLVDGSYTTDENGKLIYNERTADELSKIKTLVASAVGLNEERGDKLEVVNLMFFNEIDNIAEEEGILSWFKQDLKGMLQTIIIGIVAILTLLLVVKPLVMRIIEGKRNNELEALPELHPAFTSGATSATENTSAINSNSIESATTNEEQNTTKHIIGQKPSDVVGYLNETIDQHLDEAISVIRNWLYREE